MKLSERLGMSVLYYMFSLTEADVFSRRKYFEVDIFFVFYLFNYKVNIATFILNHTHNFKNALEYVIFLCG